MPALWQRRDVYPATGIAQRVESQRAQAYQNPSPTSRSASAGAVKATAASRSPGGSSVCHPPLCYRRTVPEYGVKRVERELHPTIGGVARAAGVSVETIRVDPRKGLLRAPTRPAGGIRRYGKSEIERLRFIKSAQRLGFSLEEIAELLRLDDGTHCSEARELAESKLADVRAKLTQLALLEAALVRLVQACRTRKRNVSCPLIASLHESDSAPQH